MKAILVLFDSLNRHMLSPYGCEWVRTPNFTRLQKRCVTFDSAFIGSMPCMPARRELHTGRHNFLHRSWGPLEPFDESMPQILKEHGVYTHLVSDHHHYWEDGGATYHTRYSSWEFARGQEGDPWKGDVAPWSERLRDPVGDSSTLPAISASNPRAGLRRQDRINRQYQRWEHEQPQARTFRKGIDFIRRNHDQDNWLLQIETFDPHEPFFSQQRFKDLYPHDYRGPAFDWPEYGRVLETGQQVKHLRAEYAALVTMCDEYLGRVLDEMDAHHMWDDTMLIVTSDHGFLLGEHGWWAKGVQPFYNELARIPFFVWDPNCAVQAQRRESLVQFVDLAPTFLSFFGIAPPADMQGRSLAATTATDQRIRETALFGIHEGHVNCTDGRYVYMRAPVTHDNRPLYNYTLMPTHVRSRFTVDEMQSAELVPGFSFTKGAPVLRIKARHLRNADFYSMGHLLFDTQADPRQQSILKDDIIEQRMTRELVRLMRENECPEEQFNRLGL